jgi:hypothetical protein
MSHENQLVNLASLNTQYSPLITFILCCARQGMGVIRSVGVNRNWCGKIVLFCHLIIILQVVTIKTKSKIF